MPAYTLESTYTDPEFGPQNMLEVAAIVGNKAYNVRYIVEAPIYQRLMPIVEEMISSIELMSDTAMTDTSTEDDFGGNATVSDITSPQADDDNSIAGGDETGGSVSNQEHNDETIQQGGEDTDFSRYERSFEEETLSIDYPSGWEAREYELDPSSTLHDIAVFISPLLSITDPYQDFVEISVQDLNKDMTLDQYLEYTIDEYSGSGSIPSLQVISYSDDDVSLTSNNYPAYKVEFTYLSDETNRQLRAIEVGTVVEGKAYFVTYTGDDGNGFSQSLPIALQMIDSFEFSEAKRTRGLAATMPDLRSQYLELTYEEWLSDNLNVMILVNPDTEEQSSEYVHEVENAINSWSQALKQYSGNPNAWNFNVDSPVGYLNSIGIGPGQEADLVIELAGDPEGVIGCSNFIGAAPPHPYELNIAVTVQVLTSCLDTETGELIELSEEVVRSTALHEFAHSLGLGHAFNMNNDLMCSAEPDVNGNMMPTCENYEADVAEISEADVAALIYKYGADGFKPPNTELRGPRPYYEVGSPTVVQ